MQGGNYKPLQRSSAPIDAVMSGSRPAAESGRVMLSLRVPPDLRTRFKAACVGQGLTMEQAGEQALIEWLEPRKS
ncbi:MULTISPECIES: ribbon-helix-helix protein [Bifidobacterium]|jgi:hypothetical protein|uniref:Uncharacterized protein n=1 Tax=Bifidobacterium subtile TaxID=77635 RepID=A0A087E5S5_9BIFI|nr:MULTISPECIES: hypothetical protein [Bifidobacterium]KFJ03126.1 hypothetical protein BISU_1058 [Bifidobacterium subtile]MCH3974401.1 hypothetical protein [Bifidobacterium tibiigranuli]MCH4190061.1 hypothetical protein [Bifidobacterium tibiigranuli]MCH4204716.1 hypothetical protein [Bifidobacterium tibiigranuli]MCH4275484.1 hypothetical protein [Bifidobacterium tibiigranuli]